ncbi:MAG: mannitol-1-phosphate 5-dehydrogenase, partial [Anaerolineae bacterium]|nr:mannitol-1-phosphate 5-dehydrogenase [Anaerolineae bacterium]
MKDGVIFGAGNIGRGFIGQLFSESGYRVVFVDIDRPLLEALNGRGAYTIRLVTNETAEEVTVGPVRGIHVEEREAVAAAVARAAIAATAVGAGALRHIAPLIAAGIERRSRLGIREPLNIIVCENLKSAAAALRALVVAALPADLHGFLAAHVGFVDAAIARMVPPLPAELRAQDPTLIIVEPYKELPVDRAGFIGEPPAIVGMVPYTPFAFFSERKLYIHNAGHAVLAYVGYRAGYEYGYQALADDEIFFQVRGAMDESALALARKYRPPAGALRANVDDVLARFTNRALGDTIVRLGRDPIRKLARSDRLVGAALNALAQGVEPTHLVAGIVAGLRFDHPADPIAQE